METAVALLVVSNVASWLFIWSLCNTEGATAEELVALKEECTRLWNRQAALLAKGDETVTFSIQPPDAGEVR